MHPDDPTLLLLGSTLVALFLLRSYFTHCMRRAAHVLPSAGLPMVENGVPFLGSALIYVLSPTRFLLNSRYVSQHFIILLTSDLNWTQREIWAKLPGLTRGTTRCFSIESQGSLRILP